MPTTTTRLALSQPAGNDAPVGLRTSIAGNATILDQAVRIFEAPSSSARRPSRSRRTVTSITRRTRSSGSSGTGQRGR